MFYTYILRSRKNHTYYIGSTNDLKKRLKQHNDLRSTFSSKVAPLDLIWYAAFNERKRALEFERYLKSSSGFAFRNKRLI